MIVSHLTTKLQTAARSIRYLDNWKTYLLDCVGLAGSDRLTYSMRDGTKFLARAGTMDRYVINEVVFRQGYFPAGFMIGRGETVVDIGAHIGIFSVMAAKLAKDGRVYSFEPNPENFDLLTANLALNGLGNVIATQEAVADRPRFLSLFIDESNTGGHSIHSNGHAGRVISVNATTLSNVVEQHKLQKIDFLKIDCEGAEYEIFRSMPLEVLAMIKQIAMECHNQGEGRQSAEIVRYLRRNGFTVIVKTEPYADHLAMVYAKREYTD